MQLRKYRWSRDYESAEEELVQLLAQKGLQASRHAGAESDVISGQAVGADITLWCAEGMCTVSAEGQSFSIQPGDAVTLSAGTPYTLVIRIGGCVWYQTGAAVV